MTARGRAALALGAVVYGAAWLFGARPLVPVAAGLVVAPFLALAWVRLSSRPPRVGRHGGQRDAVEGADVRIDVRVETTSPLPPPTLVAEERPGRLGVRPVELHRVGRARYAGSYELAAVPRGRYVFEPMRLTIEDPFGLARADLLQGEPQALVVYPRLVDVERLFSEGGAHAHDGRRLLLRRPSGFDLHSVREHVEGDSLRAVHWPSTARRGQLMVKELQDAPRDEAVVLLDAVPEHFDVAVRAAGSILQAHVRRGRRCALAVNSAARERQAVATEAEWRRALEVLAAVEPTAAVPVAAALASVARALELVVVTARVDAMLVDRLVERALSRRGVSLVHVGGAREPQLLRMQAVGVPVAVVRADSDLAVALSSPEARVA